MGNRIIPVHLREGAKQSTVGSRRRLGTIDYRLATGDWLTDMSEPILHLFWIAEYQDGTALPQFDPDTGEEHLFKEVDQSKLKHFGWYAFPPKLAQKVENAVVNPLLNSYVLELPHRLPTNDYRLPTLVAYRTTTLDIKPDGTPKSHEASEYVLGLSTADCRLPTLLHIFIDGRVELK